MGYFACSPLCFFKLTRSTLDREGHGYGYDTMTVP